MSKIAKHVFSMFCQVLDFIQLPYIFDGFIASSCVIPIIGLAQKPEYGSLILN